VSMTLKESILDVIKENSGGIKLPDLAIILHESMCEGQVEESAGNFLNSFARLVEFIRDNIPELEILTYTDKDRKRMFIYTP